MCFGVDLRVDTKKYMCSEEIGLRAQNVLIFLGSVENIHWRDLWWPLNENLHFDIEQDIHVASENFKANVYRDNLDIPIISH